MIYTYIVCVYSVCICLDTYYTRLKILLLRLAMMFQPLSLLLSAEPWNTGNPHLPPGAAVVLVQISDCSLGLRNFDISTTLGWKKNGVCTRLKSTGLWPYFISP